METGPPKLLETLVGLLIPPASREHVVGDLRERSKLLGGALGGFLTLLPLRVAWRVLFTASGYWRLVTHDIGLDRVEPDAWRRALEHRRDTLRTSWLWFPALVVVAAFPSSLIRYAGHPWPLLIEGATTLAALLLIKAMANRIADLVQHDIDLLAK